MHAQTALSTHRSYIPTHLSTAVSSTPGAGWMIGCAATAAAAAAAELPPLRALLLLLTPRVGATLAAPVVTSAGDCLLPNTEGWLTLLPVFLLLLVWFFVDLLLAGLNAQALIALKPRNWASSKIWSTFCGFDGVRGVGG